LVGLRVLNGDAMIWHLAHVGTKCLAPRI